MIKKLKMIIKIMIIQTIKEVIKTQKEITKFEKIFKNKKCKKGEKT